MIAKEQTAQAIANTAHAYEKSGVEAALSEVRMTSEAQIQEGGFSAVTATVFSRFYYSVSLLHLTNSSLFSPIFFLTCSVHSAATT